MSGDRTRYRALSVMSVLVLVLTRWVVAYLGLVEPPFVPATRAGLDSFVDVNLRGYRGSRSSSASRTARHGCSPASCLRL